MSLSDRSKDSNQDYPEGNHVCRSRSFAGFLNRSISKRETEQPGHSAGHDYRALVQRSTERRVKNAKVPKAPRPLRAFLLIDSVRNGLKECISVTKEDIANLTSGNERLSVADSQQLKAAECYLRRLEHQLARLEELADQYTVQNKLREGVRSMAHAYANSLGRERETALSRVKAGYRECSQNMCILEAHLERLMGTIELKMRGIAGFARLCPGDSFQTVIHHGTQKWKSRGHVNKDATQTWDNEGVIFKCLIGDILHVKASEVRPFGNRLIVGNKLCETKDLFSAHPQMMTVSLNSNGSLKLNLVITWIPLAGVTEEALTSPWMLKSAPVPTRVLRMESMVRERQLSSSSQNDAQIVEEDRVNPLPQDGDAVSTTISFGADDDLHPSRAFAVESPNPSGGSYSTDDGNLEDVIRSILSSIESLSGNGVHIQLRRLEDIVRTIERHLLRYSNQEPERDGNESPSSDLSVSIESALDCFDFLDDVEDGGHSERLGPPSRKQSQHNLHEDHETARSRKDSAGDFSTPPKPRSDDRTQGSSGNEEIDLALMQHLLYCDALLESLGTYALSRKGESRAIRHLSTQVEILTLLSKLVRNPDSLEDFTTLMRDITEKQRLHLLWEQCAGGHYLNTSADSVVTQLRARYVHFLRKFPENEQQDVLELLVCQMLDRPSYAPSSIVTVFHFLFFLKADDRWDVETLLQRFHDDLVTLTRLQSGDVAQVKATLDSLQGRPLEQSFAVQIAVCLISVNEQIRSLSEHFLMTSAVEAHSRSWYLGTYAFALEDERPDIRRAACRAIAVLDGKECERELTRILESDVVEPVRDEARRALNVLDVAITDTDRRQLTPLELEVHI